MAYINTDDDWKNGTFGQVIDEYLVQKRLLERLSEELLEVTDNFNKQSAKMNSIGAVVAFRLKHEGCAVVGKSVLTESNGLVHIKKVKMNDPLARD